jgi:hypothetical protein
VTKFALATLVLCIFAVFSRPAAAQSNEVPPDLAALRAELTQKLADAEKAGQDREQRLVKALDSVEAELRRLSADAKTNNDKAAQTVMLRSDLLKLIQDAKSSSDKAAQIMLDQIDALRSDQVKFQKESKESSEEATQALRQEVASSQVKLADTLKANTAPSEALTQRVDAMKKDIDELKKNSDEDRQNASNVSPGFALVVALAALVLGPFLAFKFSANQVAAAKLNAAAEVAATPQSGATKISEDEPAIAPVAPTEPQQETFFHHEARSPNEEAGSSHDGARDPQPAPDQEKV